MKLPEFFGLMQVCGSRTREAERDSIKDTMLPKLDICRALASSKEAPSVFLRAFFHCQEKRGIYSDFVWKKVLSQLDLSESLSDCGARSKTFCSDRNSCHDQNESAGQTGGGIRQWNIIPPQARFRNKVRLKTKLTAVSSGAAICRTPAP